jgi:predicted nucleic-acid-binding Zn-ribbon protein
MKEDPCPKCGSSERERGEVFPRSTLWDVRFKSEAASELSVKKKITALACPKCGFIELYMADHDDA